MGEFAILPGHALGPFRVGQRLNEVLAYVESRRTLFPCVEVSQGREEVRPLRRRDPIPPKAIEGLEQVRAARPEHPELPKQLARLYYRAAQPDKASGAL